MDRALIVCPLNVIFFSLADGMAFGCVKKGTHSCGKMIKPKNPKPQITQNLPSTGKGSVTFPDSDSNQESHVIQLSPQKAKILVIPNVEKIVDFSVTVSSTRNMVL